MRNTVRRAYVVYLLVAAFFAGLVFMVYSYAYHGKTWVTNRVNSHLYTNRQLTQAGTVYDRNGEMLVTTKDGKRIYNDSSTVRKAVLHCVGDTEGYISTGVQTVYRSYLIGYDFVSGVYNTVKNKAGNDITLTIDAQVCKTAYEALGSKKGSVGVYNYKTGEVICMVSTPTFDPVYKPSASELETNEKYEGVYINRFLSGVFTPGSTFKTVTAISALENLDNAEKIKFKCDGSYKIGSDTVNCFSKTVHGNLTLQTAFNQSCNGYFASLALKLGASNLSKTAKELGFNKSFTACGVKTTASRYSSDLKISKSELGWSGVGQGETLANPCHMLMIAGAIANGGETATPTLIKKTSNSSLFSSLEAKTLTSQLKIDSDIAAKMKKLMRSNVKDCYSDSRFPGLEMCGKTGSAERDNQKPHGWFLGFSQREDLPYAIVVVAENGGMASSVAIPIASRVMAAVDRAVNGR